MSAVFNTAPPPPNLVNRMKYTDFTGEFGNWLVARFSREYPNVLGASVVGILRSYAESPETYFVRTECACGLAQLVRRPFNESPIVEGVFVFCRDADGLRRPEGEPEGLAIITDMTRWARSMRCAEFRFPRVLDFPVMALKKLPEPPSQRTSHVVVIE